MLVPDQNLAPPKPCKEAHMDLGTHKQSGIAVPIPAPPSAPADAESGPTAMEEVVR